MRFGEIEYAQRLNIKGLHLQERKQFNYETIEIGEILGQKDVLITDEMVQTSAHAIESIRPWYFEDSPFGGRIAPPTIFDNDTLNILDEAYQRFGSIHAKQAWEFKNPLRVGKRVSARSKIRRQKHHGIPFRNPMPAEVEYRHVVEMLVGSIAQFFDRIPNVVERSQANLLGRTIGQFKGRRILLRKEQLIASFVY